MNTTGRIARTLLVLGLSALGSACSDRVLEPASSAPARTPLLSTAVGPILVQSVVVNPWASQSYAVGNGHNVYFQAGSICDPLVSSYGPGTWDAPCTPLNRAITLRVSTWRDAAGNPYVDFQPALRFVPNKYVVIYMVDGQLPTTFNPRSILYCTDDAVCVDEAQADPSLVSYFDASRGTYFRRVKHFSGYVISASRMLSDVVDVVDVVDSTIDPLTTTTP